MADANNSSFGPPPLQTPITVSMTDETGIPFQSRGVASGNLQVGWSAWFSALYQQVIQGAPGASAIPYVVPVVTGTATPDASKGTNVLILTAAGCLTDSNGNLYVNVAQPINYATLAGVLTQWQLISQQDPAGSGAGFSTVFDATYAIGFSVSSTQSPNNTQSTVNFRTDSTGATTPTSSLIDQVIS